MEEKVELTGFRNQVTKHLQRVQFQRNGGEQYQYPYVRVRKIKGTVRISLLSLAGKIYGSILVERMHQVAKELTGENQSACKWQRMCRSIFYIKTNERKSENKLYLGFVNLQQM